MKSEEITLEKKFEIIESENKALKSLVIQLKRYLQMARIQHIQTLETLLDAAERYKQQ